MNRRGRPIDSFAKSGAEKLARRIQQYWAERGYDVDAHAAVVAYVEGMPQYGIRSDMIGGMPQRRIVPLAEAA